MLQFDCKAFYDLSLDELYAIMRLRQEVFVVEQNCPYLDADGQDQKAWHIMAWNQEKQLVAYTRLMPKGISYDQYPAIGRVVSSPKARGTGAGKQVMEESLKAAKVFFKDAPIKISAQTYLIHFYESFGFSTTGKEYLEDDIPHIAMIRK